MFASEHVPSNPISPGWRRLSLNVHLRAILPSRLSVTATSGQMLRFSRVCVERTTGATVGQAERCLCFAFRTRRPRCRFRRTSRWCRAGAHIPCSPLLDRGYIMFPLDLVGTDLVTILTIPREGIDRTFAHVFDLVRESLIGAATLPHPRARRQGAFALGAAARCGHDRLDNASIGRRLRIDQGERRGDFRRRCDVHPLVPRELAGESEDAREATPEPAAALGTPA